MSASGLALIVLVSALAVAAVPFWILRDWDRTDESKAFVSTPQFVVWLLILCGQAAIWVLALAFVAPIVAHRARELRRRGAFGAQTVAAIVASAGALALVALLFNFGPRLGLFDELETSHVPSGDGWPLHGHEYKMPPLVAIAFFIGLLAIAGMWLTTVAFGDLARHARPRASRVRRFIALRTELTALLAVAGVLIGLATLSTGALREAVVAAGSEPVYRDEAVACLERRVAGDGGLTAELRREVRTELGKLLDAYPACRKLSFDRGYVLAYGLLFTGLLGIAFAPSFFAMRDAGARLRDAAYPLPGPRDAAFFDVVEKRNAFDALLETNLSASATFRAGVAIFTPLAASLVSTLLPG